MKMRIKLFPVAIALLAAGCAGSSAFPTIGNAVAVIHATDGNTVKGVITFEQLGDEVKVTAEIWGLKPDSKHGFHVHQFGRCMNDKGVNNGKGAGGHYNPEGNEHGDPNNEDVPRHAGDMGNLEADGKGYAKFERVFNNISISGSKPGVLGRAIIIHAKPDTFGPPTGDAGARIGCGVIGVAKPPTTK